MKPVREPNSPSSRRRWLSFSLRSLVILVAIVALVITIYATRIREWWNDRPVQVQTIQTVEELHEALHCKRAAIFCDAQWSLDAAVGRRIFDRFVRRWRLEMSAAHVDFYVLDMTERNDVVDEAKNLGFSPFQGSGELVWVRDGKVKAVTLHTQHFTYLQLSDVARQAFGLPAVSSTVHQPSPSGTSDSR